MNFLLTFIGLGLFFLVLALLSQLPVWLIITVLVATITVGVIK